MRGTNVRGWRAAVLSAPLLLVLYVGLVGCSTPLESVHVAEPHRRWDHNREVPVTVWTYLAEDEEGEEDDIRLELENLAHNAAETPFGSLGAPRTPENGGDGLPLAFLRPRFLGVPLPLSDRGVDAETWSDRADLIDYLASGPLALAGLEPGDMQGAPGPTEDRYRPVLDLLADRAALGSLEAITAWAEAHGATTSSSIRDPRFTPASFDGRIALLVGDFWFVLLQPAEVAWFSRLVVTPDLSRKPRPPAGRPAGAKS